MAEDFNKRIFRDETYALLDQVLQLIYDAYKDIDVGDDAERRAFTDMVYGVSMLFPLRILFHISGQYRIDQLFEEWMQNVQSVYSSSRDIDPESIADGGANALS